MNESRPVTGAAAEMAEHAAQAPAARGSAASPLAARSHRSAAAPTLARVAVLGASGYSGLEFTRLALAHPGLTLAALVSREHAGRPASQLLPGIDPRSSALPPVVDPAALEAMIERGDFDTLVCCLPHGAWRVLAAERPALAAAPARIIDLSGDHRGETTPAPGAAESDRDATAASGGAAYRYGLPEAFRASLEGSTRIANPGCYPTAAALALLPAAEAGWLNGPVMISALSGVSGAGRAAASRTSFVELEGGASLYQAGTQHPHVAEMERTLARVAGSAVAVGFAPQLVPMARGILLTASAPLAHPVAAEAAHAHYAARYCSEPFVRVLPAGQWPATRAVRSSNRCDVAVTTLHGGRTLFVSAALDNLVKGAAGQAIQNLNLMLGWPEATGLAMDGCPW